MAAAPKTPSLQGATSRRLEFIGGGSRKFWEVSQTANTFTVRFGRIGTEGQSQTKTCPDEASATHEVQKLIAAKIRKGYMEAG